MRTLDDLFDDYHRIHRHPVNQVLHALGIPLVMVGSLGLVHLLPSADLNGHTIDPLVVIITVVAMLLGQWSWRLAVFISVVVPSVFLLVLTLVNMTDLNAYGEALIWGGAVASGVVMHAIGHRVFERKAAQFDNNPAFLLAGPLSLAASVIRRMGVRISE